MKIEFPFGIGLDGSVLEIDGKTVVVRGQEGHHPLSVRFLGLELFSGAEAIDVGMDVNRGGVYLRVKLGGWMIVMGRESGASSPQPYVVTRTKEEGNVREYMNQKGEWSLLIGYGSIPADALRIPLPF